MIVEKIKKLKIYHDNDMYEITKTMDYVITNDEYRGISIFDYNLDLIKKIAIPGRLLIQKIYPQFSGNNVLIDCVEENQCLVWVNIETEEVKIIPLGKFAKVIFSPVYWWEENSEIILTDYQDALYHLDLEKNSIKKISSTWLKQRYSIFFNIWKQYLPLGKNFFFPESGVIGSLTNESAAILYNYQTDEKTVVGFPLSMTHDIAYHHGFMGIINEKQLDIISSNNQRVSIPAEHPWIFIRAVFLPEDPLKLVILSSNRGYLMLYEIRNT